MATIRLCIAAASHFMRLAFKPLVAAAPDISVVGEAANRSELVACLGQGNADLLLLDMGLPGIDGPHSFAYLRLYRPGLPILAVGMGDDMRTVRQALEAGACGYLSDDRNAVNILAAIRKVGAGGRFLEPHLAERIAFAALDIDIARRTDHKALTERELQVMRLLAGGVAVREIGFQLGINRKTVSAYKTRLMRKMDFVSIADLVRYAVTHGIE